MKGFNSSRVNYQQGKLTNVDSAANCITVVNTAGEASQIQYDVLVIATGASYLGPWRAADDAMPTLEERDAEAREYREKMKASPSILCVGAGATGLEVACYMKEKWPDKKIGVCQRGKVMMPDIKGAHKLIEDYLKKLGVNYHSDTPFSPDSGVATEYASHIDCRGFKFNGPRAFLTD